jgi:hypothetical protein
MIKLQSVAITGVEQGANVASRVGEKVGSFLNWMVSEETPNERQRRLEQERIWQDRRKALWEQERASRAANTASPNSAKHSPTASFAHTASKFVDIIDHSLGGDELPAVPTQSVAQLKSQLSEAHARIRALEDALSHHDPLHALLH